MAKQNNHNRPQRMEPQTENQMISKQEALEHVLRELRGRRKEVEAVLPADVEFNVFYSSVNQALRNNPDLLEASSMSLVNSCVRAAYDGLRLDGKEAALVTHNVKVAKNPDRYEKQAQYFPMVDGLVQQILRAGEVLSIETEVIYQADEWRIVRGSSPKIEHEPAIINGKGEPLTAEERGPMIAVYSVAALKNGSTSTAFLTRAQVEDVMKSSKSGWHDRDQKPIGVWARWPRQMWIKTMLRFHRKTLPRGERQIRDAEMDEMFAGLRGEREQPALAAAPPRPTRSTAAIEDNSGQSQGSPLDFGRDDFVNVAVEDEQQQAAPRQQEQRKEAPKEEAKAKPSGEPMPVGEEWAAWLTEVEGKILAASTPEEIDVIALAERERMAAANKERRDYLNGVITDRLAEMAGDAMSGEAQDNGTDNAGPGAEA